MGVHHRGTIEYAGDHGSRGRETWSISCFADGSKTLQAHCRMFDSGIERWVVHNVDATMTPLRSFVSHRVHGAFLGEGWFRFEEGRLVGRSLVCGSGEIDQVVHIDGWPDYFVPHAVAADAWITSCYDRGVGGWQPIRNGFTTSLEANGATGPAIEQHVGIRQRLIGVERITVPAGEFETLHFCVSVRPDVEEHLWVGAQDPTLLVQLRSDRLGTTYLLTEHEVEGV